MGIKNKTNFFNKNTNQMRLILSALLGLAAAVNLRTKQDPATDVTYDDTWDGDDATWDVDMYGDEDESEGNLPEYYEEAGEVAEDSYWAGVWMQMIATTTVSAMLSKT